RAVAAETPGDTERHLSCTLLGYRAVALQRLDAHTEQLLLGFVRVADHPTQVHVRGSSDCRDARAEHSTGARLRSREGELIRAKCLKHHDGEVLLPTGVDPLPCHVAHQLLS